MTQIPEGRQPMQSDDMAKLHPSIEVLRELIDYDHSTGLMTWKKRSAKHFTKTEKRSAEHIANNWNAVFAGKPALRADHGNGYFSGSIYGKTYYAHRVAFAIYKGCWPLGEVDHINGKRTDNCARNLREVTSGQNSKNSALSSRNKSGVIGVDWRKREKSWRARINSNGKVVCLGYFKSLKDAKAARQEAEAKYGYHRNHERKVSA